MSSKAFAIWVAGIVAVLGLLFAAFNLWQDDFGLFWSSGPKRIWDQEKSTKYLLSFRYIPNNFDGLLIGPSYSDRLDTRKLNGYRIYNLSMDGANATELRATALNVIERSRQLRFIILCLDPYITQTNGIKGDEINAKEYWGSLFSLLPIKIAKAKLASRLRPADMWAESAWGYEARYSKPYTWEDFVRVQSNDLVESNVKIDPIAYQHLRDIIDAAHQHGVRVFAFFFPLNIWIVHTAVDSGKWDAYIAQMRKLFDSQRDVIWDMTAPDYASLRGDPSCYTDEHSSPAGARLILADIQTHLDSSLKEISTPPVFPFPDAFACHGQKGAGSGYDRVIPP